MYSSLQLERDFMFIFIALHALRSCFKPAQTNNYCSQGLSLHSQSNRKQTCHPSGACTKRHLPEAEALMSSGHDVDYSSTTSWSWREIWMKRTHGTYRQYWIQMNMESLRGINRHKFQPHLARKKRFESPGTLGRLFQTPFKLLIQVNI